jgi:hypothetical protein
MICQQEADQASSSTAHYGNSNSPRDSAGSYLKVLGTEVPSKQSLIGLCGLKCSLAKGIFPETCIYFGAWRHKVVGRVILTHAAKECRLDLVEQKVGSPDLALAG